MNRNNTKIKLHLPAGLIRIRIQIVIDNFKKTITYIRNDLRSVSDNSQKTLEFEIFLLRERILINVTTCQN
jgi:hypothetical protein